MAPGIQICLLHPFYCHRSVLQRDEGNQQQIVKLRGDGPEEGGKAGERQQCVGQARAHSRTSMNPAGEKLAKVLEGHGKTA